MSAFFAQSRAWVDDNFLQWLPRLQWEARLEAQIKYILLGAGKALRPTLLIAAYHLAQEEKKFTRPPQGVLDVALALEMIHTYSLIHDDLPAMDNADTRRGRPTLHRLHSEAQAVLAGDALLTGAFEVLAQSDLPNEAKIAAIKELSAAAGARGMIAGQMHDIAPINFEASETDICFTHQLKTGALFGAAMFLGAVLANKKDRAEDLRRWGVEFGLCFQIADDLLDVTASAQDLGKTIGRDHSNDRLSYVRVLGIDGARSRAQELGQELRKKLGQWGQSEALTALLRPLAQ